MKCCEHDMIIYNPYLGFNISYNKKKIILEAEGDLPSENPTPDVPNEENPPNDTSMEQSQDEFGENQDDSFDGDMGMDSSNDMGGGGDTGTSSGMDEDDVPTGDADENAKKLILFSQFKELLAIYEEIIKSIDNISPEKINDVAFEKLRNLKDIVDANKKNIKFILNYKIVTSPYFKLLKQYFYFKESLMLNISVLEKLAKY